MVTQPVGITALNYGGSSFTNFILCGAQAISPGKLRFFASVEKL
jgi:hypothetical protein